MKDILGWILLFSCCSTFYSLMTMAFVIWNKDKWKK